MALADERRAVAAAGRMEGGALHCSRPQTQRLPVRAATQQNASQFASFSHLPSQLDRLVVVCTICLTTAKSEYTGWPKKVSHYRESSLNCINEIVNQARYFTNFYYKMSTIILYVHIKYSMYDLICDVISCCV